MRASLLAAILVLLPAEFVRGGPAETPAPREALERILKQPDYQRWKRRQLRTDQRADESGAFGSALERLRLRFSRWLREQTRSKRGVAAGGRSAGGARTLAGILKIVVGAAAVALLLVIAVLVARALAARRSGRGAAAVLGRERVAEALESGEALALSSDAWLREARRLATARNFRAVYRALYLALLSGLHSAGRINYRRQRTNWIYVRQFRGAAPDRSVFADLTKLFDAVWYGKKSPPDVSLPDLQGRVAGLLRGGPTRA